MIAWDEYKRHKEYEQIIYYLENNYKSEELMTVAKSEYKRLSLHYHYKNCDGYDELRRKHNTELECLKYIAETGKIPKVVYKDSKIINIEKYQKEDIPLCLTDLIRCVIINTIPSVTSEDKKYYDNYILSEYDYYYYIVNNKRWVIIFKELLNDYPELKNHIDKEILE
jgi:hypothetical protein